MNGFPEIVEVLKLQRTGDRRMVPAHEVTLGKIINEHRKAEEYRRSKTTNRYPIEFKISVAKALDAGLSVQKIHQATGVSLATLWSWRKPASESEEILCFKPVRPETSRGAEAQMARVVLPMAVEVLVPVALIKNQLLTWLTQDAA